MIIYLIPCVILKPNSIVYKRKIPTSAFDVKPTIIRFDSNGNIIRVDRSAAGLKVIEIRMESPENYEDTLYVRVPIDAYVIKSNVQFATVCKMEEAIQLLDDDDVEVTPICEIGYVNCTTGPIKMHRSGSGYCYAPEGYALIDNILNSKYCRPIDNDDVFTVLNYGVYGVMVNFFGTSVFYSCSFQNGLTMTIDDSIRGQLRGIYNICINSAKLRLIVPHDECIVKYGITFMDFIVGNTVAPASIQPDDDVVVFPDTPQRIPIECLTVPRKFICMKNHPFSFKIHPSCANAWRAIQTVLKCASKPNSLLYRIPEDIILYMLSPSIILNANRADML